MTNMGKSKISGLDINSFLLQALSFTVSKMWLGMVNIILSFVHVWFERNLIYSQIHVGTINIYLDLFVMDNMT